MRAQNNTFLISESQDLSLDRQARGVGNGIDLNYRGNDTQDPSVEFVLEGTEALKNRVLFWMQTKPGDFVREPQKSGIVHLFVGRTLSTTPIDDLDFRVRANFLSTFGGDLELVNLKIEPNLERKRWEVTLIVRDPINRELFDLSVGVNSQ